MEYGNTKINFPPHFSRFSNAIFTSLAPLIKHKQLLAADYKMHPFHTHSSSPLFYSSSRNYETILDKKKLGLFPNSKNNSITHLQKSDDLPQRACFDDVPSEQHGRAEPASHGRSSWAHASSR